MTKVYFIYLIDSMDESYLIDDILEGLDQIDMMEGDHIIRLYAVTAVKDYLKMFKKQRRMDRFLVKSRKYNTKDEVDDVFAELSKYELCMHPYTYKCEDGIKSCVDIITTGFESDYCVYNMIDAIPGMIISLSSLFDDTMDCLKDKYLDALEKYHFSTVLYLCEEPESNLPWANGSFEINELNIFLKVFGFSIRDKKLGDE